MMTDMIDMTDQELRALIRESIARHLSPSAGVVPGPMIPAPGLGAPCGAHASHGLLPLRSGDDDGACLIEPAVRCNHCGYCLSYGH